MLKPAADDYICHTT